ncbi:MAG: MarR family transcriptional regulator [Candidatus Nanohaloarchaeota archaeon QJJ-7]|nr:MarR family transcriptional regulator [Candidatus Nanohaloarchaeota archaeon QJJ-7]
MNNMSFVEIEDATELIAEALDMSELERECFFAMRNEEWTVKELVEETGRSRSMVQRALKELHDKGAVVREGRTDRTVYYVYQRAPLHEVRDSVEEILDGWYRDMKELLSG